jgi:hypothetical protein
LCFGGRGDSVRAGGVWGGGSAGELRDFADAVVQLVTVSVSGGWL